MNWQPIETAPKDGTWILVCGGRTNDDHKDRSHAVAQWTHYLNGRTREEGNWQFAWYDGGYYGEYCDPTHWMELPEPPK
jgi:hypothetical protein